jgi:hypothetical protein
LVKIDNSNLKKVCETLLLLKKNDYLGVSQISESNNDLE